MTCPASSTTPTRLKNRMSLRASAHTGVALSKDSLRSQSPGYSEGRLRASRGGHWPPAFLRRFPKKMDGQWPPLLALSVILILIPIQIQKRLAVRKQTASLYCNFRKGLTSTDRRGTCLRQSWPSERLPPWAYRRRRSRRTNGRERTAPGRWPSSPESAG
mgnify:CR=1 FL=1